jgi:glutamate--cysteine ligase
VEHEFLTAVRGTGRVVPIEDVRAATHDATYARYLTFEPGGQVELSMPCAQNPTELALRFRSDAKALRAACDEIGVSVTSDPVDDRLVNIPLQLTSPRYLAMQAHFDTIGPAGRRMMRRTASTQICLDWWSGRAGLEQWRVLNLAAPFLAAAYARSAGAGGRLTTWLAVDPSRTGFDDGLLRGDDPVAAYTDFAAAATVFTDPTDPDTHLSTLFPPVRPRGSYLEVRFLDAQEEHAVGEIAEVLATLLYDDESRDRVIRMLEPGRHGLADQWLAAAAADPATVAQGREIVAVIGIEDAA